MRKYKAYFQRMLDENKKTFEEFKKLHDEYSLNPHFLQEKFNKEGEKVLKIIREYEQRLCANTERGIYSKFSGRLAEKFQNELRKVFPKIDYIGLITSKDNQEEIRVFRIKKIKL